MVEQEVTDPRRIVFSHGEPPIVSIDVFLNRPEMEELDEGVRDLLKATVVTQVMTALMIVRKRKEFEKEGISLGFPLLHLSTIAESLFNAISQEPSVDGNSQWQAYIEKLARGGYKQRMP